MGCVLGTFGLSRRQIRQRRLTFTRQYLPSLVDQQPADPPIPSAAYGWWIRCG
jgi:hypothetical protein